MVSLLRRWIRLRNKIYAYDICEVSGIKWKFISRIWDNLLREPDNDRPQLADDFCQGGRGKQLLGSGAPPQHADLDRQPPHRRARGSARRPPSRTIDAQPAAYRCRVGSSRAGSAERRTQRCRRQYRLKRCVERLGDYAAFGAAQHPGLTSSAAGRCIPGLLPECPRLDLRNRAVRRSYSRGNRSGIQARPARGFNAHRAEDPDLPTSTRSEPDLSQAAQAAENAAGSARLATARVLLLEARQ